MSKILDLVKQEFGRLTVQEFAGKDKRRKLYWNCICDCGNTKRVRGDLLKSGNTRSCGCLHKDELIERLTTHGQAKRGLKTKEYQSRKDMIRRCYNPKHKYYKDWGGRGIKVCLRWLGKDGFKNFYNDMGDCPEGMSLDRKDNDGDYTPENCRWATNEEQQNNRRNNVWYIHKGETKTLPQWALFLGINTDTLRSRLNLYNWSVERTLTTPVRKRRTKIG